MTALINQACWVVDDMEVAARNWAANGVGPFLTFDVDMPDAIYRGAPVPLRMTIGLAQAGPMQIELIQQHSPGPSAYRDVVPEGASGFHHVFRVVDDYDAAVAELKARGIVLATEAFYGAHFCYADTRGEIGAMTEIAADSPLLRDLQAKVTTASLEWDGTTLLRPLA